MDAIAPGGDRRTVQIRLADVRDSVGLDFSFRSGFTVVECITPGTAASRADFPPVPFIVHECNGVPVAGESALISTVSSSKERGVTVFDLLCESAVPASTRTAPAAPGADTVQHVIALQSPGEKIGMVFQYDGQLRVVAASDAAERCGIPTGYAVILRALNGVQVSTPQDTQDLVREAQARGETRFVAEFSVAAAAPTSPLLSSPSPERDDGRVPAVPAMTYFEPAHSGADADKLWDAARNSALGSSAQKFTFPADTTFWDNFQQQVQLYSGAQDAPVFEVSASHDARSLLVNREFMRGFVKGWEEQNPHTVTVFYPGGEQQFHVSQEFWDGVVGRLADKARERDETGAARPRGALEIVSSMHPDAAPIVADPDDWDQACAQWEDERGLSVADRKRKNAMRWAEVEDVVRSRALAEDEKRRSVPAPAPASAKETRSVGTQWVDPADFIYVDRLEVQPMHPRRSPFSTLPPMPWDAVPRHQQQQQQTAPRLRPDRGVRGASADLPERVLSPSRADAAVSRPYVMPQADEAGDPLWVTAAPVRVPASEQAKMSPARPAERWADGGGGAAPFWDSFVEEWAAAAASVQRGGHPARLHTGQL